MSFKADLHVHTLASDGKNTYEEMIAVAKRRGLNAIAFTDHDTLMAKKIKPTDFLIIPGIERTTDKGHVVVLGEMNELPPSNLDELLDFVAENNLVAFAPHPFDFPVRRPLGIIAFNRFKLVEGINGGTPDFFNLKAIREAERRGIKWLCNSDAHAVAHLGRYYNIFEEEPSSVEELLELLRKGKFRPAVRKVSLLDLAYRKITKILG